MKTSVNPEAISTPDPTGLYETIAGSGNPASTRANLQSKAAAVITIESLLNSSWDPPAAGVTTH